jgi:apolipoprotein D and lipocalin family protein
MAIPIIGPLALALGLWSPDKEQVAPLRVVPHVDLKRYAGSWHEVARLPNRFQKACASDTVATYELKPDGKISVSNQCTTAEGKVKTAKGTAKLASSSGPNTKLRVTFFWPFYGDYWIIDLDPEYRWAVIGEPSRKYFWVLSREPVLDDRVMAGILERARAQGYSLEALMRTPQKRASNRESR